MDLDSKQFRVLGSIAITIVGFQIVRKILPWLYLNIVGPKLLGPKVDLRRMGNWAVVTGATDGIGKAYAKALAKKGLNLVLISRSPLKLESVAKEIGDATGVEVKTIDVDFTGGPEIYEKIQRHIQGLEIGVLINNVGISLSHPEYFLDYNAQNPNFLRDIIAANIHSVTHMCNLVMPGMLSRKKGVVVNVSSTAAVIPNPLLTVYSATKAFVDKFSVDLQTEYQGRGIVVQSVQPGFVATNMTKIRKPSLFSPSADTYVESALRTIGIADRTAGYLPHALMQAVIHEMRDLLGEKFARSIVFMNLLDMRKRAHRNAAKKQ